MDENSVNHCTWRSHNSTRVLETSEAKQYFLHLLRAHKDEHGVQVISYSLMGTHPHVQTRSTRGQAAFSKFWKVVNQRFALWWNRRNGSCGQVVMQRMRSPLVQDGRYQLTVMRYGDLNPVRAGLVKRAGHWPWSSFRHYAYGEKNELVTDAAEYVALGSTPAERRKAYLHFFAAEHCADLCGRRPALVVVPFIGDEPWVWRRLAACGLSPPGRTGHHRAG